MKGDDMGLGWFLILCTLTLHFTVTNCKIKEVSEKLDVLVERTKGDTA